MNSSRALRAEQGSRRKRDLAAAGATGTDAGAISRATYLRALAWAESNLPDEHGPFAAAAAMTLKTLVGRYPDVAEVRERLKAQGRDLADLEEL